VAGQRVQNDESLLASQLHSTVHQTMRPAILSTKLFSVFASFVCTPDIPRVPRRLLAICLTPCVAFTITGVSFRDLELGESSCCCEERDRDEWSLRMSSESRAGYSAKKSYYRPSVDAQKRRVGTSTCTRCDTSFLISSDSAQTGHKFSIKHGYNASNRNSSYISSITMRGDSD
jgi:hypothetical protein